MVLVLLPRFILLESYVKGRGVDFCINVKQGKVVSIYLRNLVYKAAIRFSWVYNESLFIGPHVRPDIYSLLSQRQMRGSDPFLSIGFWLVSFFFCTWKPKCHSFLICARADNHKEAATSTLINFNVNHWN